MSDRLNPEKVRKIVNVLKKMPKGEAVSALSLYLKLLKQELDKHRLVIETPQPLTKHQLDGITKIVSKNKKIFETEIVINTELLAGFRLKMGDQVFEDSFENRIEQVREAIRS